MIRHRMSRWDGPVKRVIPLLASYSRPERQPLWTVQNFRPQDRCNNKSEVRPRIGERTSEP